MNIEHIEYCGAHSNKLGVCGKHQVSLLRKYKNVEYPHSEANWKRLSNISSYDLKVNHVVSLKTRLFGPAADCGQ